MINFFRKTRKKMADDNRPLKYMRYAIGEIVLVVIGILIALSINNWNEERKERILEKVVLHGVLGNIERNNILIRESLLRIEDFDKSSNIVLSVLRKEIPYSDTLAKHFFNSGRTGGLLFPISSEGYESLKNEGFNIIHSAKLKDQILKLFEVSLIRIQTIAQWTMSSSVATDEYNSTLFRQESSDLLIPINFDELTKDNRFYSSVIEIKESKRGFMKKDLLNFLHDGERLLQLINDELKE
jgi:hypothetical protein